MGVLDDLRPPLPSIQFLERTKIKIRWNFRRGLVKGVLLTAATTLWQTNQEEHLEQGSKKRVSVIRFLFFWLSVLVTRTLRNTVMLEVPQPNLKSREPHHLVIVSQFNKLADKTF